MPTLLVTGAAGFIGSALCRLARSTDLARVVGVDSMTYASSRESLANLIADPGFELVETDVANAAYMSQLLTRVQPDAILHLAAETHVDRSIDRPADFLRANIVGTFSMLETTRVYLTTLSPARRAAFRFVYVSTDEVYGPQNDGTLASETAPNAPSSPYAASKASGESLAMAWHKTYGVPVIVTNGANTYGPLQFPEKLIPLCLTKALRGEALPLYGDGTQVRDWLYVDDHARALLAVWQKGRIGQRYNIAGSGLQRNIDMIQGLCALLDELAGTSPYRPHAALITHVADRPGHDARYAMDGSKLTAETGWQREVTLEGGLRQTVAWYIANQIWCQAIRARKYAGERLGTLT